MKSRMFLAVSLAVALTGPAFAQDSASTPPKSQAEDQPAPTEQPAPPAESAATTPEAQPPAAKTAKPRMKHRRVATHAKRHAGAHPSHVPGNPPVIDHSADHMIVTNPPTSTVTVPPDK